MKRKIVTAVFAVLLTLASGVLYSQSNNLPMSQLASYRVVWEHDGIDVEGFKLYVNKTLKADLGAVARQTNGTYTVPLPTNLARGDNMFEVTAYSINGESVPSNAVSRRVVGTPNRATNLDVVR